MQWDDVRQGDRMSGHRRRKSRTLMCVNGCGKPTLQDRRICMDCRRTEAREYARYRTKLINSPNFNSESCNCKNPGCNGLQCERVSA